MNQKGGLIGNIKPSRLAETKIKQSIPQKLKKYINIITIPNTEIIRVGSSISKINPHYSDVDIMNIIDFNLNEYDTIDKFTDYLLNMVNYLSNENQYEVFFSDFKAGNKHWTAEEIFNNIDILKQCFLEKAVIKIDMFAPYNERYIEMSTFFILKSKGTFINVEDNYFESMKTSLINDINEFKKIKPFKAVKRAWSLARITQDNKTMRKLEKLIRSNVALLGQINADLETIELMVQKNIPYNKDIVLVEISEFKEKISNILDIEFDEMKIDIMIDNILLNIINNSDDIIDTISTLHDYLLEIINKETLEYLEYVGYYFPSESTNKNYLFSKISSLFQ